ncbi:MAG: integrin alpha, partial [Planctomycetota bacterium]
MFSGKSGKVLHRFVGANLGDNFGFAVSGVGDVNQDGHADVLVGAPQPSYFGGPGYARVFSGKDGKILLTVIGLKEGDGLGFSVSSAGDVNRDKYPDLIIGAAQVKNAGIGYVGVRSGKDGKTLFGFSGGNKDDKFGWAVSGGMDIDADGYPDVCVGAPGVDQKGIDSGSVRVFSGKDGRILHTLHGDAAGDRFGCGVAAIGDVDKDGHADFVVGADEDDNRGKNSGCARVFSGKRGSTLYSFDGDAADDKFGRCVSAVGDLNQDGHVDFVVGAPEDDNNA